MIETSVTDYIIDPPHGACKCDAAILSTEENIIFGRFYKIIGFWY